MIVAVLRRLRVSVLSVAVSGCSTGNDFESTDSSN